MIWNRARISSSATPRYECCECGGDAMPSSVAELTMPKPTAKTTMPRARVDCACAIAAAEPPLSVCSPSVSTRITRKLEAEEEESKLLADCRPAAMSVCP